MCAGTAATTKRLQANNLCTNVFLNNSSVPVRELSLPDRLYVKSRQPWKTPAAFKQRRHPSFQTKEKTSVLPDRQSGDKQVP